MNLIYKKGNAVVDTITLLVVLLVFIMFILLGKYIFSELNDDIQADPDMHSEAKALVSTEEGKYSSFFDGLFLFFFILLWILMLVSSFQVDSHPVFFIVTIILMFFVFFVGAMLGNVYEEFAEDDDIAAIVPEFPMAHWMMTHFLTVVIVVGFSIVIVLFGKNRAGYG